MAGEKKDNVFYNDKFNRAKFQPTLSHFGGKAAQGWVALTASGMVGFFFVNKLRTFWHLEIKRFNGYLLLVQ